jgi:hypothetical protein
MGYYLLKLVNNSVYITVETRVYTQSSVFRSEGFLGKGFAVRVWAPFVLCFYPCGPCAWWQESSFSLWHRDPLVIHELNLCLSILNRIYTYCGYCAIFRGMAAVPGMFLTHLS